MALLDRNVGLGVRCMKRDRAGRSSRRGEHALLHRRHFSVDDDLRLVFSVTDLSALNSRSWRSLMSVTFSSSFRRADGWTRCRDFHGSGWPCEGILVGATERRHLNRRLLHSSPSQILNGLQVPRPWGGCQNFVSLRRSTTRCPWSYRRRRYTCLWERPV